jgi:hypothetical protein
MANEVDLTTYTNTIQSLGLDMDKKFDEINVFLNNEITKDSATKYLNLMSELVDRLNAMEITEKQRDILRNAFLSLFSTMASDECKTKMIKYLGESNKAISKKYNEVCKVYQKERDSYNEMAKKYNEKLKEEKVIIPSIQLSVTLKDDKKLSNQECVDLLQEVGVINEKVFGDKFQRLGVKELQGSHSHSKKIDRLYAKKSDGTPLVIQKNSQKGG